MKLAAWKLATSLCGAILRNSSVNLRAIQGAPIPSSDPIASSSNASQRASHAREAFVKNQLHAKVESKTVETIRHGNSSAATFIESLLPPPPTSSTDRDARFLFIDPLSAGDSNKMLALASGVALAAATNRTPLANWNHVFADKRFGDQIPAGLMNHETTMHKSMRTGPCYLSLNHAPSERNCWAPLFGLQDPTQFMAGCKIMTVASNQYFLPLVMRFRARDGRSLEEAFSAEGHEPLAVMMKHLFRPPSALTTAIDSFIQSLAPTTRPVVLLTVHLRNQILRLRTRQQVVGGQRIGMNIVDDPTLVPAFLNCAVHWAKLSQATHVYVASDYNFSVAEIARLLPENVTVLSYRDLETFSLALSDLDHHRRATTAPTTATTAAAGWSAGFADLADSLLLGRGQVCVGTPGSTFSKIATNWYGAENCKVLVEADKGCVVVGGRTWSPVASDLNNSAARAAAAAPRHVARKQHGAPLAATPVSCAALGPAPPRRGLSPNHGHQSWGESSFSGHVISEVFGCDGHGCPDPTPEALAAAKRSCAPAVCSTVPRGRCCKLECGY